MVKRSKKFISIVMTLAVVSGFVFTCVPAYETKAATSVSVNESETYSSDIMTAMARETTSYSGKDYGLADNVKQGAILHAWCWSFNTIKENLKDIAEAGFTTVQTSPANTCIVGDGGGRDLMGNGKWYYHYQPVDWKIGNYQLGSRDEFKAMCDEADKYGVKIIVDVLPNHTTSDRGSVSQNLINAAGGMDKLYHKNWDVGCTNWTDRNQITNYKYSTDGCPDVCTENPGFQKYYVEYLNDLIACGVDGFRYDTAKHIGLPDDPIDEVTRNNGWTNNFWPVALGQQEVNGVRLNGNTDTLFVYGEVLQDAGSRDADYGRLFNLTASNYGGTLRNAIGNKDFNANSLRDWHNAAGGDRLVTWVESHDTYCNDHKSGWMSDWDIRMCWAVIASRASGTPLFYSRPDGSNGSQGNYWGRNKIGEKGNDQFKDPEVVAVNQFRNAMIGNGENMTNYGSNKVLAIERGNGKNAGVTIINLDGDKNLNGISTNLADGTYYDKVYDQKFVVSGGKFTEGTAKGGKITVLYEGNPINNPTLKSSKKSCTFTTDSINLTLTVKNCTNAKYKIDNGSAVSFTDGKILELGKDLSDGESITLTLTATDSDGNSLKETYTYKKKVVVYEAGYLYVDKVSGWGDMYAYVYKESSGTANKIAEWPGVKMTYNSETERYEYKLPSEYQTSKTQVIFTDGKNQIPASRQPGEFFKEGKAMYFDGQAINIVNPTDTKKISLPEDAISFDKASPQEAGTSIKITTKSAENATGTVTYEFIINDNVEKSFSSSKVYTWTPKEEGTYEIKVVAKDSKNEASATAYYKITKAQDELKFTSTAATAKDAYVRTPVSLSAKATGGNGTLKYRFVAQKGGKTTFAQDYSTKRTATWTPKKAGTYKLYYKVKDEDGTVKTVSKTYTVKAKNITFTTSTSVSTAKVGESVGLSIKVTGSTTGLKYRFVAQKSGKTTFAQDYSTKRTATWTPKEAGTYTLYFKVKDTSGKIVTKTKSFKVEEGKAVSLTDVNFSKESPQAVGTTIKITATGKSTADNVVYYKVSVHEGVNGWKTIKNYSSKNYVNWKTTTKGKAYIMVEVMDSAGDYDYQIIPYTVK